MARSAALLLACVGTLSANAQVPAGDFLQGPLISTGITTDLAIDGTGFFVLRRAGEPEFRFTRAGKFRLNSEMVLVALDGRPVLAFQVNDGVPDGPLAPVDLSNALLIPRATTSIKVNVNLDPSAQVIATSFNHLEPATTSNYQTGIRVFDSLGNARTVQIYFRRTAANAWDWFAGAQRSDIDMTLLGGLQGSSAAQSQFVVVQSGSLRFATDGTLLIESNAALAIPFDADGNGVLDAGTVVTSQDWPWAGGAAAARIAFDFGTPVASGGSGADMTTQFGGGNFLRMIDQDGYASGSLQSISIDIDGSVEGGFSNGQTALLARLVLATFGGTYWLERIDDTKDYRQTELSGPPTFGQAHDGPFGMLRSGFLEDLCATPQRLCESLPPLELCEQKLAQCEATGRLDGDADGEPDPSDHCPGTIQFADVDTAGCSQQQFCAAIEIRDRRDRLRCSMSDWKNDEPTSLSPHDCVVRPKRSGRAICAATP